MCLHWKSLYSETLRALSAPNQSDSAHIPNWQLDSPSAEPIKSGRTVKIEKDKLRMNVQKKSRPAGTRQTSVTSRVYVQLQYSTEGEKTSDSKEQEKQKPTSTRKRASIQASSQLLDT